MRIAVTGATGFVGSVLCRRLEGAGHDVVRLGRRPAPGVTASPLEFDALRRAVQAADAVVHLAARVHVMRDAAADPLAEFRRTNVEGTDAAYRTACAVGARRFLFVSSVKVMGEASERPYTDADAPAPVDPYGISKLEAEHALARRRAEGGACAVTVLRPPLVYGPGATANFRRLVRLARLAIRWPLPLGTVANRRSLVAVENLADAILHAVVHPAAADETFLVADHPAVSTTELIRRLARAQGGEARLWTCPVEWLRRVGSLVGRAADVERLLGSLEVDAARFHQRLGWTPPMSFETALAAAVRPAEPGRTA